MRLWTLHPRHLDPKGLVALWREALLAQAVLHGRTRGYTNHPQLTRFKEAPHPRSAISAYLEAVFQEAVRRGYSFDRTRIVYAPPLNTPLFETGGQVLYEWAHLGHKLRLRAPGWHRMNHSSAKPTTNPVFRTVPGGIRQWERVVDP